MAKNPKRNEQVVMPDGYGSMDDGNANTTSDGTYGDFTYTEVKVGNVTKPIRRSVVSNQLGQAPYPENTADPWRDPDLGGPKPFPENPSDPDKNPDLEDPRNGVVVKDELPGLDEKIGEALVIFYKQPNAGEPDEKDRETMRSAEEER